MLSLRLTAYRDARLRTCHNTRYGFSDARNSAKRPGIRRRMPHLDLSHVAACFSDDALEVACVGLPSRVSFQEPWERLGH